MTIRGSFSSGKMATSVHWAGLCSSISIFLLDLDKTHTLVNRTWELGIFPSCSRVFKPAYHWLVLLCSTFSARKRKLLSEYTMYSKHNTRHFICIFLFEFLKHHMFYPCFPSIPNSSAFFPIYLLF
jgi:hypothetical protein